MTHVASHAGALAMSFQSLAAPLESLAPTLQSVAPMLETRTLSLPHPPAVLVPAPLQPLAVTLPAPPLML